MTDLGPGIRRFLDVSATCPTNSYVLCIMKRVSVKVFGVPDMLLTGEKAVLMTDILQCDKVREHKDPNHK